MTTCLCTAPVSPPRSSRHTRPQILTPEDAHAVLGPHLVDRDREHCLLLSVDVRNRRLGVDLVSLGTCAQTFMAPREVYRSALLRGAARIFLAHNHPSGDPEPSAADRAVTRRLRDAGNLLGVELLDHLVVGDDGFVSMARRSVI